MLVYRRKYTNAAIIGRPFHFLYNSVILRYNRNNGFIEITDEIGEKKGI